MRAIRPLILFTAVTIVGLGSYSELDVRRDAERAPAFARAEKTTEKTAPAPGIPAAPPADAVRGEARWPREGERWIYRFARKANADFGGKPWLRFSLGGRAAVESAGLASHGGNRFYRISFEVDRLELQDQVRAETRSFPGARVEVDREGKVRELRFITPRESAVAVTEEEADFVRDLSAQWLFFENHTRLGAAEIEWSRPGKRLAAKRVTRYPARPEISKLDSLHEWALSGESVDGAHVERIEGNEDFTLASANGDFVQSTSYRWVWVATEKTEGSIYALGAPFRIEDASGSGEPGTSVADPARIAAEWPKLKTLSPHERLKLFRDTKRALDAGANELVSLILRELKGKRAASIEWRTGVGALAATSNPEAAKALLALYREDGRMLDEKLSILSGVAAGEGKPAPDWKTAFEGALAASPGAVVERDRARLDGVTAENFDPSRDYDPEAAVREASLYALGSSIRKETDASLRQGLETMLWREVKDARTEKARTTVLEAIGNSGSGEYYAYVKEQFAVGTPRLRAKAVVAVRFLASDLAKPIIDRAKGDPVPAVRKSAEWSERFQTAAAPDPVE